MRRHLLSVLVVIGLAAAVIGVTPTAASASATKCAVTAFSPSTCIHVQGSGNRVDRVSVGLSMGARQGATGHWYVWGVKRPYETPVRTLWNSAYYGRIVWAPLDVTDSRVSGTYPDGTSICAQFHTHPGNTGRGIACITVHR
jgi:hypothetical protein